MKASEADEQLVDGFAEVPEKQKKQKKRKTGSGEE